MKKKMYATFFDAVQRGIVDSLKRMDGVDDVDECFDVDASAEDVVKIHVPWDEGRPVDISKVSFYIDENIFDKSVSDHSKGA